MFFKRLFVGFVGVGSETGVLCNHAINSVGKEFCPQQVLDQRAGESIGSRFLVELSCTGGAGPGKRSLVSKGAIKGSVGALKIESVLSPLSLDSTVEFEASVKIFGVFVLMLGNNRFVF